MSHREPAVFSCLKKEGRMTGVFVFERRAGGVFVSGVQKLSAAVFPCFLSAPAGLPNPAAGFGFANPNRAARDEPSIPKSSRGLPNPAGNIS